MNISKNSWHYKLANFDDRFKWDDRTDLCSYGRALLIAVTGGGILFASAMFVLFCMVVSPLLMVLVWLQTGVFLTEAAGMGGIILWGLAVAGALLWLTIPRAVKAAAHTPPVELVKAGYRGWKEKTCVLIDIQD